MVNENITKECVLLILSLFDEMMTVQMSFIKYSCMMDLTRSVAMSTFCSRLDCS